MTLSEKARAMGLTALVFVILPVSSALADDDYFPPVTHKLTQEECAACHMAFPAIFLPPMSWNMIMETLDDHFGEDASLNADAAEEIRTYLAANASRRTRGIDPENPPLRITELKWFLHEHGKRTRNHAATTPEIGTISNCTACHRGADQGFFDDD